MRKIFFQNSPGFTLIEMLVAMCVVLLLSGMTLGALRASRNHQVLDQAAARFAMLLSLAQTMALSENESVYLVIADHESLPERAPMRAYTFIKDLDDPHLLHHWQVLPKDVVFAEDDAPAGVDLITAVPIRVLENAFVDQFEESVVEGQLRVLLELSPEKTLKSGASGELQAASLLLERGEWIVDAANNGHYKSLLEEDPNAPIDQFRIHFRPLSGTVRVERVLP